MSGLWGGSHRFGMRRDPNCRLRGGCNQSCRRRRQWRDSGTTRLRAQEEGLGIFLGVYESTRQSVPSFLRCFGLV